MADVFLSYARPSLNDAMRIADCLRAAGYSVWYDESLPAHRAYTDVIAEQLDAVPGCRRADRMPGRRH